MRYTVDTTELRKEMLDAGYKTIVAFSDAADVSRVTMGKVLSGEIRPSADVMDKIAAALNLAPAKAGSIFFVDNLRST